MRMTSHIFIVGTGFEKCMPPISGRRASDTSRAISAIGKPEVLDTTIALGFSKSSSSLKMRCFNGSCSGTASIRKSTSLSAVMSVVNEMRGIASTARSNGSLPISTARFMPQRLSNTSLRVSSMIASVRSRTTTS